MMGAGKTTLAKALSNRWEIPWVDLDALVEDRLGRSIAQTFAQWGESVFRETECQVLADLVPSRTDVYILATGGGTPLEERSRQILREKFLVVWLDAPVESLYARAQSLERPLIHEGQAVFRDRKRARDPIYRELAHLRVDVSVKDPDELVDDIVTWWKEHADEW